MPSPIANLMSVADFKAQTYVGAFYKRSHLVPIDRQLERTLSAVPNAADYPRQLLSLIDLCTDWLNGKQTTTGANVSPRHKKRAIAVSSLRNQACLEYKTALFAERKNATPNGFESVGLAKGYAAERADFLEKKAQLSNPSPSQRIDPRSASVVDVAHRAVKSSPARMALLSPEAQQASATPFQDLNKHQFALLSDEFGTVLKTDLSAKGYLPRVHYVRKLERISNNMLIPLNGLLYGNVAGPTYSTLHGKVDIYAIDRYGNLMVSHSDLYRGADPAQGIEQAEYRHSSLNAGNDVICAGRIVVKAGKIQKIDNWSGHYRPSARNLANAIAVLEGYSLEMSATEIKIFNATTEVSRSVGINQFKSQPIAPVEGGAYN